jgi:hypothetical protein
MLDSGASMHFTNDINDFIEYQTIPPIIIRTATSQTSVVGKGAVLLMVDQEIVRVQPVYHIPELNTKLLSLRMFLKNGLHSRGSACSIIL